MRIRETLLICMFTYFLLVPAMSLPVDAADSDKNQSVEPDKKSSIIFDRVPDPYPQEPRNTDVIIQLSSDVANGDHDVSPAIQQAIDKLPETGGTVVIPPGRYYIANTLKLRSNVTLLGASPNQTFVKDGGPSSLPVELPAPSKCNQASVLIQADDLVRMIVVDRHEGQFSHDIAVRGLNFVVVGNQGNKNHQFIEFRECKNVYLGHCSFDSSSKAGAFGMFHQVDFTQCVGTTCIHNRFHNGLAGTGVNGFKKRPVGAQGYFAMNLVTEYVDTGVGLWTGAHNCLVERNVFRGYSKDDKPYAVGVDCDGPYDCIIRQNIITGGQIGVRICDCHDGDYPITNVTVERNWIADQRSHPNGNPAACIKAVHNIHPGIKLYNMDFDIYNNHFEVVSKGILMYSYAKRGGTDWCSPGIRENTFVTKSDQPVEILKVGGFRNNGQYIFQTSRNDFGYVQEKTDADPLATLTRLSEAHPVIKVQE